MTFTPGTYSVAIKVNLIDIDELKENLRGEVTPETLKGLLIQPFETGDIGVTLTDVQVADGGTYNGLRVDDIPIQIWTVSAEITDAALFERLITAHYADMWHDANWAPGSAEEAIYEAFLASNDTASPVDYGYEIVDWSPAVVPDTPAMEI